SIVAGIWGAEVGSGGCAGVLFRPSGFVSADRESRLRLAAGSGQAIAALGASRFSARRGGIGWTESVFQRVGLRDSVSVGCAMEKPVKPAIVADLFRAIFTPFLRAKVLPEQQEAHHAGTDHPQSYS